MCVCLSTGVISRVCLCVCLAWPHEGSVLLQYPRLSLSSSLMARRVKPRTKERLLYLHACYIKTAFVTACMLMTIGIYSTSRHGHPSPRHTTAYIVLSCRACIVPGTAEPEVHIMLVVTYYLDLLAKENS